MTSSFGVATSSLTAINLWNALTQEGTHTSNFSRCVNLQKLNISYNGYQMFDTSICPHSLIELNMECTGLEIFPDIAYQTPFVKKWELQGNSISSIPPETIQGLKYVGDFDCCRKHYTSIVGLHGDFDIIDPVRRQPICMLLVRVWFAYAVGAGYSRCSGRNCVWNSWSISGSAGPGHEHL